MEEILKQEICVTTCRRVMQKPDLNIDPAYYLHFNKKLHKKEERESEVSNFSFILSSWQMKL